MSVASDFFQRGVPPSHRSWTGLWGLIGEHFPVRSSDGGLSLSVVGYEVVAGSPASREGQLSLTWQLTVSSNEQVVDVREQPLTMATIHLPTTDGRVIVDGVERQVTEAELVAAYTRFLARLEQALVARLDEVGFHGKEMPWNYLRELIAGARVSL